MSPITSTCPSSSSPARSAPSQGPAAWASSQRPWPWSCQAEGTGPWLSAPCTTNTRACSTSPASGSGFSGQSTRSSTSTCGTRSVRARASTISSWTTRATIGLAASTTTRSRASSMPTTCSALPSSAFLPWRPHRVFRAVAWRTASVLPSWPTIGSPPSCQCTWPTGCGPCTGTRMRVASLLSTTLATRASTHSTSSCRTRTARCHTLQRMWTLTTSVSTAQLPTST
mmetsp:Transcript_44332/g.119628  ORF Transcript_44332/g.119628 Transcript_44332/m.119628 type:complete len:227 (+) Transcript_44332:147-827(+)